MEILSSPLGTFVLLEANKFWFYALIFSLLSSFLQLIQLSLSGLSASSTEIPTRGEKAARSGKALKPDQVQEAGKKRQTLMKRILTDASDLLIPGAITGWLVTSPATVGMATVASTLLSSEEIWVRVQRDSGR